MGYSNIQRFGLFAATIVSDMYIYKHVYLHLRTPLQIAPQWLRGSMDPKNLAPCKGIRKDDRKYRQKKVRGDVRK